MSPSEPLGIELEDTTYRGPAHLVYNPIMATIDEDTVFSPGINSAPADYMRISDNSPKGKTVLQFIHYIKVTNDHVDKAEFVGALTVSDPDMHNLSTMITQRIKQIDSTSS